MIAALLVLLACSRGSDTLVDSVVEPAPDPDTDVQVVVDTDQDTDSSATGQTIKTFTASCDTMEFLDVNLLLPKTAPFTSYLLVDDGYGLTMWTDAREGVIVWDRDGLADFFCFYSGKNAAAYQDVDAVRVVWVAEG